MSVTNKWKRTYDLESIGNRVSNECKIRWRAAYFRLETFPFPDASDKFFELAALLERVSVHDSPVTIEHDQSSMTSSKDKMLTRRPFEGKPDHQSLDEVHLHTMLETKFIQRGLKNTVETERFRDRQVCLDSVHRCSAGTSHQTVKVSVKGKHSPWSLLF